MMEKPIPIQEKPVLDYNQMMQYINEKYKIDVEDYGNMFAIKNGDPIILNEKAPYLNYWHWLTDNHFYEVYNGQRRFWHIDDILSDEYNPEWVKEITLLVKQEFAEYMDEEGNLWVLLEW